MSAPPARKVVAVVKCTTVELKLTLNAKTLAKPLADACITPFLGVYNKKKPDETPVTAEALVAVTVDGQLVTDIKAIADKVLTKDSVKIELFPSGAAAPPPPEPTAAAAPPEVSKAPEPAKKPAAAAPAAPAAPAAGAGPNPLALASNTMPRCKYGLACRIIDPVVEMTSKLPIEQQHWYKFQHPCYWTHKEGHPEIGPPGQLRPLTMRFGMSGLVGAKYPVCPPCMAEMIIPCTNMDPDHRRCFRHPEDDEEIVEVVDESTDELDEAVIANEATWTPPDTGTVSEDDAMEAKMAAAEAAGNGDFEGAVAGYSKALAANPSALTYAKRAEALLKLGFPSAAIADCEKALEMNPDSAKTYKVAAKALTKKGEWTAAYNKLCTGNKIDEDEDSAALQKRLKTKCDKMKKIAELHAKRAEEEVEVS